MLIYLNSGFLMKIKFPSSVTRKFYLYLITRKFPSYAAREFKFHLKKTSYVTQKFYSFFILTNTSLSVWLENFHFGYLKGFFVSFGDLECKESFAQSWVKKQTNKQNDLFDLKISISNIQKVLISNLGFFSCSFWV